MSKYILEFLETKSPDWKVASIRAEGTEDIITDVSINAKDKGGTPFPNFQNMMTGHTIEGDFWTSDKGKKYLFPPKPQTSSPRAFQRSPSAITKAMEKKEESIGKFQDNKEMSIKVSSTLRMAVDTALAFMQNDENTQTFEESVRAWRKFYWMEWNKEDKDFPPFI